jgi:hypothetical protein
MVQMGTKVSEEHTAAILFRQNGGSTFHWNAGIHVSDYKVSNPGRTQYESWLQYKPQIPQELK